MTDHSGQQNRARPPLRLRWSIDIRDAGAATNARRALLRALRAEGADESNFQAAEIIFGELIGNAARYAPGVVEVTLDWTGEHPVLHVVDRGPGFCAEPSLPTNPYAESGRGLFIVSRLGNDLSVQRGPHGTHVRVRLPVERRRQPH